MAMENGVALQYYECITAIEAQEKMVDLPIADYPHLKQEERNKIHRSFSKLAHKHQKQDVMSSEQLEGWMKRQGLV